MEGEEVTVVKPRSRQPQNSVREESESSELLHTETATFGFTLENPLYYQSSFNLTEIPHPINNLHIRRTLVSKDVQVDEVEAETNLSSCSSSILPRNPPQPQKRLLPQLKQRNLSLPNLARSCAIALRNGQTRKGGLNGFLKDKRADPTSLSILKAVWRSNKAMAKKSKLKQISDAAAP